MSDFTKRQIQAALDISTAIDKARDELGREFNAKTAASISYHLIHPKGRLKDELLTN